MSSAGFFGRPAPFEGSYPDYLIGEARGSALGSDCRTGLSVKEPTEGQCRVARYFRAVAGRSCRYPSLDRAPGSRPAHVTVDESHAAPHASTGIMLVDDTCERAHHGRAPRVRLKALTTQTRHSCGSSLRAFWTSSQAPGAVWLLLFPNTREVCGNFTRIGADLTANTWRPVGA